MLLVAARIVLSFLSGFFNILLSFKIFTRHIIHNIFNISLACLLVFHGIVGPLLAYFYFKIMENFQFSEEDSEIFDNRFVVKLLMGCQNWPIYGVFVFFFKGRVRLSFMVS
jgi:hypothetical protein